MLKLQNFKKKNKSYTKLNVNDKTGRKKIHFVKPSKNDYLEYTKV